MAIDPKKIAAYEALSGWLKDNHRTRYSAMEHETEEALSALLADRVEMLVRLDSFNEQVTTAARFIAGAAPDALAAALALLREVEWSREVVTSSDHEARRVRRECPVCEGLKPVSENDVHGTGHFDGCRLGALLGRE